MQKTRIVLLRRYYFVFFVLLLLGGCTPFGRSLQPSSSLGTEEQEAAKRMLNAYCAREKASAVDANITFSWTGWGQEKKLQGVLLAQHPAFFRFTMTDPLGQPLLLLVADGKVFQISDTMTAQGYTGPIGADFLQEYIPSELLAYGFAALSADLDVMLERKISCQSLHFDGKDRADGGGFWFSFQEQQAGATSLTHQVRITTISVAETQLPVIVEHRLLMPGSEEGGEEETRLSYADFSFSAPPLSPLLSQSQEAGKPLVFPGKVVLRGSSITGTYTLLFDSLYSFLPGEESAYTLRFPSHYHVETVQ